MSTFNKQECYVQAGCLVLQDKNGITRISFSAITAIYSTRPYLIIETADRDYLTFDSLKHMESILPSPFVRVNKSAIINLTYVIRLFYFNQKAKVQLINGCKYDISRRKTSYIKTLISDEDPLP